MSEQFFPPRTTTRPMIYAYSDRGYPGKLKIGFTGIDVEQRVRQQYPVKMPSPKPYAIVFQGPAMRPEGDIFLDTALHDHLEMRGFIKEGEWFNCTKKDVEAAYLAVMNRTDNIENRTKDFAMRPEQEAAVARTMGYFQRIAAENEKKSEQRTPKFLWNAKMRFGKTFATYQLAKRMGFTKVLVLTFKPAVQSAWREDLMTHMDFEGWQFISRHENDMQYEQIDHSKPFVCFGSFQDYLGVDTATGGIKAKNEWVHLTNWDIVVFDEYHFGAWKENAKGLFAMDDEEKEVDEDLETYQRGNAYDESFLPITTNHYLYLSGTPFRALNSGEFIEEQIYNWTYANEQQSKREWVEPPKNPYAALPRMVMMVYRIPDSIRGIASKGEYNEFDLNEFFAAEGTGKDARFKRIEDVQKWLNLIRGAYLPTAEEALKLGAEKPPMPFSDVNLLGALTHTLWLMPNVASCYAMANLLKAKQNTFYHDYTVNIAAGTQAGIGLAALEKIMPSMRDPLRSKTITLSCGKLTTGVTVKPWTGVFMLRNLKSPETYFQTAFRVQSPWTIRLEDGSEEIIKKECYLFDFSLDRALHQVADYSCRLNTEPVNAEVKVGEFLNFLPVLAYDGSTMTAINATNLLDFTTAGTSATLLARRWQSALLVNVDNDTLSRLLASPEAMAALMRIEGFRALNQDIETIINKSEAVKKAKKSGKKPSKEEKKEISEAEKEYKSKRKEIQNKLIKFATRIPIFMYLTDHREQKLIDVITQLEQGLFTKVTGLTVQDFDKLVSLGVFNESLMNEAIYKFRRYEESSLSYAGVDMHEGESVGLFSTVLTRADYDQLVLQQQASIEPPARSKDDKPEPTTNIKAKVEDEDDEDDGDVDELEEIFNPPTPKAVSIVPPVDLNPPSPGGDYPGAVKGAKVRHKTLGEGEIISITPSSQSARYVNCMIRGTKRMFAYPDIFLEGRLELK